MAFTQVTVTGTYRLADGSAAEGFIRFTPRVPMHNENVVVSAPVVATLDGAGAFSKSLAATDDAGTLTADGGTATYRVELVLAGQPARSYQIVLGHADVTQNLADIITVTPTLTAADWLTQTQADALYTSFDVGLDAIADLTPANDDVLQRKAGTWTNRTIAQLAADLTVSAVQPKDADLTAIAGLTATSDNFLQAKSSAWASRTPTQVAADLVTPLSSSLQPLDSDLTAIAALSPSNDDVVQRKAGTWTNRTMAQVKTDLGLSNVTNNAQVTGVTAADGTITIAGTSTAPTVAVGTGLAQSKITNLTTDLAAKLATTDAPELIRDTIGTALVAGSNVTITPNDGADTITIAATGGGGSVAVQDEGSAVTSRSTVNFVGAGVRVTDDATNTRSLVAVHGNNPSMWRGLCVRGFTTGVFDGTLMRTNAITAAQAIKTDSIAIVFNWYQATGTSTTISATPISTTELTNYIRYIKSKGYKVLLKPHLEPADVTWRGAYAPTNVTTWFTNYTTQLVTYATIAQAEGVDMFSVGSEYKSLTVAARDANWRAVIAAVRAVYSGPLTYGANATQLDTDEFTQITFWDALDNIGIDLYPPLDYDSTDSAARVASYAVSDSIKTDTAVALGAVARQYGKPVVLNEYGYSHMVTDATVTQHAVYMGALLDRLTEHTWFHGGFAWAFDDGDVTGVNADFTSGAVATAVALRNIERVDIRPDAGLRTTATWRGDAPNMWSPVATISLPRESLATSAWLRVDPNPTSTTMRGGELFVLVQTDGAAAVTVELTATAGLDPTLIGYTVAAGVVTLWIFCEIGQQFTFTPLTGDCPAFVTMLHLADDVYTLPSGITFASLRTTQGVVVLTDGATVATDASKGTHFRLTAAGSRTLGIPTNAVDGMTRTWEHIASGAGRTLSLTTGAGGFKFGTTVTALTATTSGLRDLITCTYSASLDRWMVRTVEKGF